AAIRDERAHLPGQFAQIVVEEALMLPIDDDGLKKRLAVEIAADADLHAGLMAHQHEIGFLGRCPKRGAALQQRKNIPSVLKLSDIMVPGDQVAAIQLEAIAAGIALHMPRRRAKIAEGQMLRGRDARFAQAGLTEFTVILKAITEGTAANDIIALPPSAH